MSYWYFSDYWIWYWWCDLLMRWTVTIYAEQWINFIWSMNYNIIVSYNFNKILNQTFSVYKADFMNYLASCFIYKVVVPISINKSSRVHATYIFLLLYKEWDVMTHSIYRNDTRYHVITQIFFCLYYIIIIIGNEVYLNCPWKKRWCECIIHQSN